MQASLKHIKATIPALQEIVDLVLDRIRKLADNCTGGTAKVDGADRVKQGRQWGQ